MKLRGFISLFQVLLWFAATHHCIFENCATQSLNSKNINVTDCPSHEQGDPQGHTKGRPCSVSMLLESRFPQAEVSIQFDHVSAIASNIFLSPARVVSVQKVKVNYDDFRQSLEFFTFNISPNAPPLV